MHLIQYILQVCHVLSVLSFNSHLSCFFFPASLTLTCLNETKYIFLCLFLSQAGHKEKSDALNMAIDKMTKKTRDLRRQVCSLWSSAQNHIYFDYRCQQEYFTSFYLIIYRDCLSLDAWCLYCIFKMNIPNPGALSDQTLAKGLFAYL